MHKASSGRCSIYSRSDGSQAILTYEPTKEDVRTVAIPQDGEPIVIQVGNAVLHVSAQPMVCSLETRAVVLALRELGQLLMEERKLVHIPAVLLGVARYLEDRPWITLTM